MIKMLLSKSIRDLITSVDPVSEFPLTYCGGLIDGDSISNIQRRDPKR